MRAILAALAFACLLALPANAGGLEICGDRWCDGSPAGASATFRVATQRGGGVSLHGVVAPLAAKARQIVSACGSRVISAVRHTRVRGSGRLSLHASGRAVDIAGNPKCIFRLLKDWPGGFSTDYAYVKHVHISYWPNGREWGARFSHWRPRKVRVSTR